MDLKLKGKVAIVTGASYGIGEAIAKGLAQEGPKLAICARGEEKLMRIAAELKGMGAEVLPIQADVMKTDDVDRVVRETIGSFGRIDILVNNAGGMVRGTFAQAKDEDWQQGIELNVYSIIHFCQKVIPDMRERNWGRIINIASVWGHQPGVTPVYNVTKAAVLSLSKSLSNELGSSNVLVNCVSPGGIISPAWIQAAENLAKKRGTTWQEEIQKLGENWAVLRRFGNVEEIADVVVFLASERSSYITGACINVDGGATKSMI